MFLLRRMNKALTHLVMVLLLVQFVTPAFAQVVTQGNTIEEENSFKSHHDSGFTVGVFLKESVEEKNPDHRSFITLPPFDFSFHASALKQVHENIYSHISNQRLVPGPIFKLIRVFLI